MKKRILIIPLLIVLSTIVSCQFYEEKDLGNNLILWEGDAGEGQYDIVYCGGYSFGSCKGGIYVLPIAEDRYSAYVKIAESNAKWVIAKSIRIEDNKENYWIISKNFSLENVDCNKVNCDSIIQSHVVGPFDESSFNKELKEKNINLTFDK